MTNQARIAIVGTGWWATATHIPALLANKDAELVALCDRDEAKLAQTAQAYHVGKTYTDVADMLAHEPLDGVIVATNHASHFTVARASLAAGKHTLVEKPLTLFAPEARELVETAQNQGVELTMGYNHQYTPYAIRAREIVQGGSLGAVQYITGVFNQHIIDLFRGKGLNTPANVHSPGTVYSDPVRSGGGHGHLQITHLAGLLFFITGLRARKVHAMMHKHGLAVDVVNAINVQFEGGALAAIGGTGNIPNGRKIDLQIYCENGWIDIDEIAATASIQGENFPEEHFMPYSEDGQHYPRYATTNNLVDIALGRAENGAPGTVGWRAVELLDAAYRSAALDGEGVLIEELYHDD
jgi:predicted dehydrogenase